MSALRALIAGAIYGLFMFLANTEVGVWWLAPLAVTSLALPVRLGWFDARPKLCGLLVAAGGAWFWLVQHRFVIEISEVAWVPMGVYLSLYQGLFVWWLTRAKRRWPGAPFLVVAAVLWSAIEALRGEIVFDGYAWYHVGQPLIESAWARLPGAWIGLYGVSFMTAVVGAAAAEAAAILIAKPREQARGRWVWAGSSVAVVGAVFAVAAVVRRGGDAGQVVRVAVVQTNVPQSNKLRPTPEGEVEQLKRLLELSQACAAGEPDVIIWPETMKPGLVLDDESVAAFERALEEHPEWRRGVVARDLEIVDIIRKYSRLIRVPMLIGEEAFNGLRFEGREGRWPPSYDARFNSVFQMVDGALVGERYDKMRPTPFGETMPYVRAWPWLERKLLTFAAGGMKLDLGSGTRPTVLTVTGPGGKKLRAVTPICFEATETGLCRSLVFGGEGRRADVIVNLTNDGWFMNQDSGRRAHLQLARWRCVELATPMARAANTGLSGFVDAFGGLSGVVSGVGGQLEPWTSNRDGWLAGVVTLGTGETLYGHVGNVVGWGCFGLAILERVSAALGWWKARRAGKERTE